MRKSPLLASATAAGSAAATTLATLASSATIATCAAAQPSTASPGPATTPATCTGCRLFATAPWTFAARALPSATAISIAASKWTPTR